MNDDLNKKIKQITDILGQENLPDNLKGLLSILTAPTAKEEISPKAIEAPVIKEEKANRSETDDSIDMLRKVKKIMDKVNTNNDPKINLLNAIKPFLNNKRQKRLNDCMKLLQMSSITKLLDDPDKSIFK
jgi:hypothetical protein